MFRALFESESWLAIVMITDLLGRKDRFNVPGTAADSNWTRRLHTTVAKLGRGHALHRQLRTHPRTARADRTRARVTTGCIRG